MRSYRLFIEPYGVFMGSGPLWGPSGVHMGSVGLYRVPMGSCYNADSIRTP